MRDVAVSIPRTLTRFGLAAAAIALSVLSIWVMSELTNTYSIHLCGWPGDLLSCARSARVFWLIPIAAAAVGFAGASLLIAWATRMRNRGWLGVMHSGWTVAAVLWVLVARPRSFGVAELILGGIWFGFGVELIRLYGLILFPDWRRTVHVVATILWVGLVASLLWVPTLLEAAALTKG